MILIPVSDNPKGQVKWRKATERFISKPEMFLHFFILLFLSIAFPCDGGILRCVFQILLEVCF